MILLVPETTIYSFAPFCSFTIHQQKDHSKNKKSKLESINMLHEQLAKQSKEQKKKN